MNDDCGNKKKLISVTVDYLNVIEIEKILLKV